MGRDSIVVLFAPAKEAKVIGKLEGCLQIFNDFVIFSLKKI